MSRRWPLALAAAAALSLPATAMAADLQFGTAWTAAPGAVEGLPAVDRTADATGRVVYYTPRRAGVDTTLGTGYLRSLGPVGLSLYAEFAGDEAAASEQPAGTWSGGLKLTYEGFGLGGSLLRRTGLAGTQPASRDAYELTGSYSYGRLTVGLAYQRVLDATGSGVPGVAFDEDPGDYYRFGLSYQLSPGLTLGGGVQLHSDTSETTTDALPGGTDSPTTILMLGTAIKF
jgi:hypothetical protein